MTVPNPKPMHPGLVVKEALKMAGMTQAKLAEIIGCSDSKIWMVIHGRNRINSEFAIGLEKALGTSAETWMTMQAHWDLHLSRKRA